MEKQGSTPSAPSESFAELKAELLETGTASDSPREKRQYKKRSTEPAVLPDIIDPKSIGEIADMVFGLIASRKGEHWKLQEKEKETLSALATRVINKRSPQWISQFGDEIALGFVAISILMPRIKYDMELAKKEQVIEDVN